MSRTHIVTASSTVKQERRLPLIEGMSVKDLADIQIKQLTLTQSIVRRMGANLFRYVCI